MKTLRVTPPVDTATRRRIYENAPSPNPVRDAGVYAAVKTLRGYGKSEEETEREIASYSKDYKSWGLLSPDLAHQICRRYARQHARRVWRNR